MAAFGHAGAWLRGRRSNVPIRYLSLANELLANSKAFRKAADPKWGAVMDRLEDFLLIGDYPNASGVLDYLEPQAPEAALELRRRLPLVRAPGMRKLKKALAKIKAISAEDPFELQAQMVLLVGCIDYENIPKRIGDKQLWLCKRASALAR